MDVFQGIVEVKQEEEEANKDHRDYVPSHLRIVRSKKSHKHDIQYNFMCRYDELERFIPYDVSLDRIRFFRNQYTHTFAMLKYRNRCNNCKLMGSMWDHLGSYKCYAHFGCIDYVNVSNRGRWSCCGKPMNSIGCRACDHYLVSEHPRDKYDNVNAVIHLDLAVILLSQWKDKPLNRLLSNFTPEDRKHVKVDLRYRLLNEKYVDKRVLQEQLDKFEVIFEFNVDDPTFPLEYKVQEVANIDLKHTHVVVNVMESVVTIPLFKQS